MISMDKKYKYRNGEPARVLCVDRANSTVPVVALTKDGVITLHTDTGRYLIELESGLDLIEVNPWDDFKIDEPVLVRDSDDTDWMRACFAGVDSKGNPTSWFNGKNSWTTSSIIIWRQCRRPTPEELGETK
jgi:hypothetical protein